MRIRILGCSGGIGVGRRTTALLVDDDILIDAGTGVGDLDIEALARIDHVFFTHSHLDHVAALPFLLDTVGAGRRHAVTVHAQEATLAALRGHIFNNAIWPDFSRIPTPEKPFMKYATLAPGAEATLGTRRIRSVPVNHVVPAVGYLVRGSGGSLAFSGDTTVNDSFWQALNACDDLKHVIIETSFLDAQAELSRISKHLCPSMLVGELRKLKPGPSVHITHLQPGLEDEIMAEIARHLPRNTPRRLMHGEIIEI
ncbi:MAG: 3',5'-cyclic-nucleotide phosphodiesterase [Gammaproteobacteria bacterium]|nr:3',5'-cyclic-nucleotide phosphodiesterase [Gammaproteobacteria bacterium]